MLLYEGFHALRTFVVKNMAFWGDACCSDYVEEGDATSLHIGASSVFQWGNKCGVGVYFYHDHYVFLPTLGIEREADGLV